MRLISAVLAFALVATLVVGSTAPSAARPSATPAQPSAGDCTFPVTLTDATGTAVTLTHRPTTDSAPGFGVVAFVAGVTLALAVDHRRRR